MAIDRLRQLQIPDELSRQRQNELIASVVLAETRGNPSWFVQGLSEIVASTEFENQVRAGGVSYAMIKPRLHEATQGGDGLSDAQIEQRLIADIQLPLRPVVWISFVMDEDFLDEFYAGKPKDSQLAVPPIEAGRYGKNHANRWDEFRGLMTTGPVTAIILESMSPDVSAIDEWRRQMGTDWNVDRIKQSEPNSLRARYALDNHNNVFHGSDSPESVMRELKLVVEYLGRSRV